MYGFEGEDMLRNGVVIYVSFNKLLNINHIICIDPEWLQIKFIFWYMVNFSGSNIFGDHVNLF